MFHEIVERKLITFAFCAVVFEDLFEAVDDLGEFGGKVVGFGGILFKVVELPIAGFFGLGLLADGLPGEVDDGELSAVAMEFPDHGFASFEDAFGERGSEVGAVEPLGSGGFGDGAEGGEPIGEVGRCRGAGAGLNFSGPADDGGDADTALVDGAFPAPETGRRVEEGSIDPTDVEFGIAAGMGRSVVRGEDHDGVLFETMLFEAFEDGADVLVEIGNHGSVASTGSRVGQVAVLTSIRPFFIVPLFRVAVDPLLGRMHGDVGLDEGKVEEKGLFFVFVEEFESFFKDAIRSISLITIVIGFHFALCFPLVAWDGTFVDGLNFLIVVEEGRKEGVSIALAVIAVESIESLFDGGTGGVGGSESPFAEATADVSAFLESFGEGDCSGGDWPLTGEFAAVFGVSI